MAVSEIPHKELGLTARLLTRRENFLDGLCGFLFQLLTKLPNCERTATVTPGKACIFDQFYFGITAFRHVQSGNLNVLAGLHFYLLVALFPSHVVFICKHKSKLR